MIIGSKYKSHTRIGADRFTVVMELVDSPTQNPARQITIFVEGNTGTEVGADITRELAAFKAAENTEDVLVGLPVDFPFAVDLPTPDSPTAFETWMIAVRKWQNVKATLVDSGIKTGSETEIAAIKTAAVSGYQASYLANF